MKSGSEKAARLRSKIASLRYGRGSQSAKIIAVTGAHGKSTVVKLIAELLREGGLKVVEMVAASDADHSFETDPFLLHRRLVDASRQNYDYVVCGHIHQPEIRDIITKEGKVTYLNSGDWVENLTALEYNKGKWELIRMDEITEEAEEEHHTDKNNNQLYNELLKEFNIAS